MLNLPKMVIDEISGNEDFVKIIIYVSIMLVISLVSSLIVNMFVGEMLGNRAEYISQAVGIEIAMKHCELDMAQLDDPKVHDLRSLAGNVRGLSFGIINGILGVFSSGVMIVSTIVILWKSGWWVILVIFAMSLISVLTSDKIQDMEYKHTAETTRMFRYQYYYQGLFSDPLVQKDIRFFRIFSWIKEKYYAMFFKNTAFKEEQEYRFVFKKRKETQVLYREKDGFLIPYIQIQLSEKRLPVKEIMVAPQNHIDLAQKGMEYMMAEKGYSVTVELSNIKLRY